MFPKLPALVSIILFLLATPSTMQAEQSVEPTEEAPSFKEVLSLAKVGAIAISPDGQRVAYTLTRADWQANRYDTEIYLAGAGGESFALTRTVDSSSRSPKFSPDGAFLFFLADRGEGEQIHRIRIGGGEARPLTRVEDGVSDFEVAPDGESLAVLIQDEEEKDRTKLRELYGEYAVEDAEARMTHLWSLDLAAALENPGGAELPEKKSEDEGESAESGDDEDISPSPWRRLTRGADFTVTGAAFSPDSKLIAFSHQPGPSVEFFNRRDLSILDLEKGESRALVEAPGYDDDPIFSPDGRWVLFQTRRGETAYFVHTELAKIPTAGGEIVPLTADFDEEPQAIAWLEDGIRFTAYQRSSRQLFRLDPENLTVERELVSEDFVWEVDYAADGGGMAYVAATNTGLGEIFLNATGGDNRGETERLTTLTDQIEPWPLGTRERITWRSQDGLEIEGVLWKPEDYDASRSYPLLVAIHGGPTGISVPRAVADYVYPFQHWLMKGALILEPNYRGSAGYGNAFRGKNYRNLGVGDAWDVLSGVDHLVEAGVVDSDKIGAMGWSQGGYISAFLATSSDAFQAISMGAGISNWMTYYVNTDIHPFTRHYLGATPWEDPEIYAKTSPMTKIKNAKTPLLIQHGESDRRVPIPNAYEIYQGFEDQGVPTRLVVYKGFGHVINKPKERLVGVWHNWQWFARHLWGEEVEIPLE